MLRLYPPFFVDSDIEDVDIAPLRIVIAVNLLGSNGSLAVPQWR